MPSSGAWVENDVLSAKCVVKHCNGKEQNEALKKNLAGNRKIKMASFRDAREMLLYANYANFIDDTEFLLLYDCNTSHNPDFPYWKSQEFDLDKMSDAECKAEFRFYKNDIYNLADLTAIPENVVCYNRSKIPKLEAFCIFLKRFAYPCRYGDMMQRFARSVPELSMVSNNILNLIHTNFREKIESFDQPWLSPVKLQEYAEAIHDQGAPLDCCWGFVDGTVRPICRPGRHQKILYNGHKRIHSIKFQSVVTPNGLIANLYGPMEGCRHDCALLAASGILGRMEQFSYSADGRLLCIYGDPAYPLRQHLQGPFKGAHLTEEQKQFNKAMSAARVSVEWIFGDILTYFKFLDFKKNLKIGLSAVGKMYKVNAIMHNIRTCLYKNLTSNVFGVEPPSVEEYLS